MAAFKAWISILVAGGLGLAFLNGYQLPLDPDCIGRCRMDSLARMQRDIGSVPLGILMIILGLFGFIWYSTRS